MDPDAPADLRRIKAKNSKTSKITKLVLLSAFIAILGLAFYYWVALHTRPLSGSPQLNDTAGDSMRRGASIAVLPFKNLSGDAEQEYFRDGITNDIITDLSRFRELLVIASNTVYTCKGKSVPITEIGRQLGVLVVRSTGSGHCGVGDGAAS